MKSFKNHGYKWDTKKQQWYFLSYGYEKIHDKSVVVDYSKEILIKSGIGKNGGLQASIEAIPTRGRTSDVELLFGSDSDRFWFSKKIKKKDESKVANAVKLIDDRFKIKYDNLNLEKRGITTSGDEWYVLPKNGGIEQLQKDWFDIFEDVHKQVFNENPVYDIQHPFSFRAQSGYRVLNLVKSFFQIPTNYIGFVFATMGWGKTYLYKAIESFVPRYKNSKIVWHIYTSISSGQQAAVDFAKIQRTHSNIEKREIIYISSGKPTSDMNYFNIKGYEVGADNLALTLKMENILLDNSEKKYSILIQKDSAIEFEKLWFKLLEKLIKQKIINNKKEHFYPAMADEIDVLTGSIKSNLTWVWRTKMFSSIFGATGTPNNTSISKLNNKQWIYNDSPHLNAKIIDIVTPKEATKEGTISPIEFRFVSHSGPLTKHYSENPHTWWELPITKERIQISSKLLRAIDVMLYGIKKDKHQGYLFGVSEEKLIDWIMTGKSAKLNQVVYEKSLEQHLKENYPFLKDYTFISGKRDKHRFDNMRKANNLLQKGNKIIFIATPWFFRSNNINGLSGCNTTYNVGNVRRFAQGAVGRIVRIFLNKIRAIVYIDITEQSKVKAAIETSNQWVSGQICSGSGKIYKKVKIKPTPLIKPKDDNDDNITITEDYGDMCPPEIIAFGNEMTNLIKTNKFDKAKELVRNFFKNSPKVLEKRVKKHNSVESILRNEMDLHKSILYRELEDILYNGQPDWDRWGNTQSDFEKEWIKANKNKENEIVLQIGRCKSKYINFQLI